MFVVCCAPSIDTRGITSSNVFNSVFNILWYMSIGYRFFQLNDCYGYLVMYSRTAMFTSEITLYCLVMGVMGLVSVNIGWHFTAFHNSSGTNYTNNTYLWSVPTIGEFKVST